MDHEVRPWKMALFHGLASWSKFHDLNSLKNQFTKLLGPSLGVNRMWTKSNDRALKNQCVDFFNICSKWGILKTKRRIKFDLTLVFSCLHLLFPNKKFIKKILSNNISLPLGPYLFQLKHLFCLSHRKIH